MAYQFVLGNSYHDIILTHNGPFLILSGYPTGILNPNLWCVDNWFSAMEGQSDKSSAMSDSGGPIDLSVVSTASSEKGDSSLGTYGSD